MMSQDDAHGKTGYKHKPMPTFDCDAASSSLAFDWAVEASLALAGAAVVSFPLLRAHMQRKSIYMVSVCGRVRLDGHACRHS
jgi:hypothetical protein